MKCKTCGAIIHEGDTFCRTCATPVEKDNYINTTNNQATFNFEPVEKVVSEVQKNKTTKEEPKFTLPKNFQKPDKPQKPVDNKDFIDRDANNRTRATIINIGELVLLIIVLIIIVKISLEIFSSL